MSQIQNSKPVNDCAKFILKHKTSAQIQQQVYWIRNQGRNNNKVLLIDKCKPLTFGGSDNFFKLQNTDFKPTSSLMDIGGQGKKTWQLHGHFEQRLQKPN